MLTMKGKYITLFGILAIVFLASGCVGFKATTDQVPLGIAVDRLNYTPLMSSTVGIGLTPQYPAGIDNATVGFRWQTDYGYFLSWGAPDFKVNNNGKDVTGTDRKVYWSYSPDDMGKEKPTAHVTLTMVDRATGRAINTTGIDIGWESRDVARVIKAESG